MKLTREKIQLCSIQGRLFELSANEGIDSAVFIDAFMQSGTAARLDLTYDRLQWSGEEYILEELADELGMLPTGTTWGNDELFWTGYLYRLWHYTTGESSSEINRIANAATMRACYPGYHTLDPEMAIERLREAAGISM
ncbi:MAG: hypothetical protein IJ111_08185 [Eggerthellaceae bacterium]|nr:hypothetical protein [Eggerthellaceae bacterium]